MSYGRSKQFIEKWKRSRVHVFLNYRQHTFYLVTPLVCPDLVQTSKPGEFAVSSYGEDEFVLSLGEAL